MTPQRNPETRPSKPSGSQDSVKSLEPSFNQKSITTIGQLRKPLGRMLTELSAFKSNIRESRERLATVKGKVKELSDILHPDNLNGGLSQ